MRAVLLLVALIVAPPSFGSDFDYAAYQTVQLAEVAAGLEIDPRVNYWYDAAHPKYHAMATYSGNMRAVSPEMRTYVEQWVKTMGQPDYYHKMFQSEIEVTQGSSTYWLPIQQPLVAPFGHEVAAGTQVHLYVLLLGAINQVPVFVVSEFNAVGG